jgi:hypothetical protein
MSQMFNPPHPGEVLRDYLPETIVGSLTRRLTLGNRQNTPRRNYKFGANHRSAIGILQPLRLA